MNLKENAFVQDTFSGLQQKLNDTTDNMATNALDEMEKFLESKDPKLVKQMNGKDETVKFMRYRNRIAELAFEEYKEAAMAALRQRSQKTGRKIRESKSGNQTDYWLDEGELDTAKCTGSQGFHSKKTGCDGVNEELQYEREHMCFYPDGFEAHALSIVENDSGYSHIVIHDDYSEKNLVIINEISLFDTIEIDSTARGRRRPRSERQDSQQVLFDVGTSAYEYKEFYRVENLRVQDIRDGMYVCGKTEDGHFAGGTDSSREWPSMKAELELRSVHKSDIVDFSDVENVRTE